MKPESRRRAVRVFSIAIIAVVLLVLLSGGVSAAGWWNPIGWAIKAIELVAGVIKALINLVKMVVELKPVEVVTKIIGGFVKGAVEKFFDAMKHLLTLNPTVYCPPAAAGCKQDPIVRSIAPTIMTIIQPLYVTMALFTGIYYIFAAMEPRRRAAAKNMLLKLLVGMVIVGLSLPIFQLILDLSSALTEEVFDRAYAQFAAESSTSIAVFAAIIVALIVLKPILLVIAILVGLYVVIAVLLVMGVRYVAVLILAILFPAALFLYFFDATKNLGTSLVYQTLSWIFVPVVQAFMIVITFFAFEAMLGGGAATVTNPTTMESTVTSINLTTAVLMFFMVLGGLAGVIIAPLVMMQWMKWVGGAIAGYGALKIPQARTKEEFWGAAGLTALGGSMMGGVSKGMQYGATQAAYMAQQFAPSFGATASWSDVMPSFGEIRGWFSRGSGQGGGGGAGGGSAGGGGSGGGSALGGGGASSQPWVGAAARARAAGGHGRGLVRDFFETYATALNYDRIKSAELIDRYGSGSGQQSASGSGGAGGGGGVAGERGIPLTTATTLAGSERNRPNQYTIISDDSHGARDVGYLGKAEGPPFLSIPLYFFGGIWGDSLKRASTQGFAKGDYAKGIGISLFETFKVFSPFRPVRHLGRILYTAIPEFIPPFIPFPVPFVGWTLRDVAWWGSRKMSGVGLGQMASRGSWNLSLAAIEGDFNGALKRLRKAEGMSDGTAKDNAKDNARKGMDEAAKRYAKMLDDIKEGPSGTIRKMSDLDLYNKKMEQLRDHNPDLNFGVRKYLTKENTKGVDETRGDVLNAVEKVSDASGNREKLGARLKKEEDNLKKQLDEAKKEGNQSVQDELQKKFDRAAALKNPTLLLFDYIGKKHGGNIDSFKGAVKEWEDESRRESDPKKRTKVDVIEDFMKYDTTMKFGIGVSEWEFNKKVYEEGTGRAWSKKQFNLDEMEDYIRKHEATGASLVTERDGKFRMSAQRLLYGEAYNCAVQNEITRLPDGRVLPNIYIFDTTTSSMVETARLEKEKADLIEKHKKLGSPPPKQKLDDLDERIDIAKKKDAVYAFVNQDGSEYTEIMRKHHETGGGLQPIWGVDAHGRYKKDARTEQYLNARGIGLGGDGKPLTAVEAERILGSGRITGELDRAERGYEDATHALGEYGLSEGEKVMRQTAAEKAKNNLDAARKEVFDEVRRQYIRDYEADLGAYLSQRYGGRYTVDSYRQELGEANKAFYFGGTPVQQLRERGYHEREIDHLKLVLYKNPRYQELIDRGETVDVRIADKPENPNVSWVNTDKLGRRSLTINVGHHAYGKADHQSTPAEASLFMRHLEHGVLPHEATHDRIREQYGQASYTEIWDDFARGGDRLKNVFDEQSLNDVRVGIADALRLNPDELDDEKKLRGKLRKRLTKEDLGFMLSEGLADASTRDISGGGHGGYQQVYNDSMRHFVSSEAGRISDNAGIETTAGDVSLLARMESLASQETTGYVDEKNDRDMMEGEITGVKGALNQGVLRGFKTQVDIYKAIHSNAVLI
jgi:hypothetical protein